MSKGSHGTNGATNGALKDHLLAKELALLASLPSKLDFPPPREKRQLKAAVLKRLKKDNKRINQLDKAVRGNRSKKKREQLEIVKGNPEPGELNMQLALTRLVAEKNEQEEARSNGRAFQVKYNLTNDQMFTLCRLAIQIGVYENTDDLDDYLKLYAKMDPALRALTPDAIVRLGLGTAARIATNKAIIGSCSCSCP